MSLIIVFKYKYLYHRQYDSIMRGCVGINIPMLVLVSNYFILWILVSD